MSREQRIKLIEEIAGGKITPGFVKNIYENFLTVDKDGSGLINYHEYLQVIGQPANDQPNYRKLFTHFDFEKGGEIELQDFIVGMSIYTDASVVDKLKFAYLIFDNDSSGYLERDEVRAMMRATHPEVSNEIIDSRVDEIYMALGLQPIHRVSYERFMNLVNEKPALLIEKEAMNRSLKKMKLEDVKVSNKRVNAMAGRRGSLGDRRPSQDSDQNAHNAIANKASI